MFGKDQERLLTGRRDVNQDDAIHKKGWRLASATEKSDTYEQLLEGMQINPEAQPA